MRVASQLFMSYYRPTCNIKDIYRYSRANHRIEIKDCANKLRFKDKSIEDYSTRACAFEPQCSVELYFVSSSGDAGPREGAT